MVVRPERRKPIDLVVTAALAIAVLVAGTVVWFFSDARATVSAPSTTPIPAPLPAMGVPEQLSERWRAPSPATPIPTVAGTAVITAVDNTVTGHDATTGKPQWTYSRDLPVCTVGSEWDRAIAVFRTAQFCSEITALDGGTGKRGPQRNSDAEADTRLISDGKYMTASGRNALETWRSDLVRTQQYGNPPAWKNPGNNLKRPHCTYSSAGVSAGRLAVIEQCPGDPGDRLTVLAAKPADDEKPEEILSTIVGGREARIIGVRGSHVAVAARDRAELLVYDFGGALKQRYALPPLPTSSALVEPVTGGPRLLWHTGQDTIALDPATFVPVWTVPQTLGSGVWHAGAMLIPVRQGIAVYEPHTGAYQRTIPLDRQGYTGPVSLSAAGGILLEQRGDTLVALG